MKKYIKPAVCSIKIEQIMWNNTSTGTYTCRPYSKSATQLSKDNDDDDWEEEY